MKFSRRAPTSLEANRLTRLLEERKSAGGDILDLTVTNPTTVGIYYPEREILEAIASAKSLRYEPHPQGLLSAREAVAAEYACRGIAVHPQDIFLTASTSEAYSLIFKLLLDPGQAVLTPRPGYPLIPHLAAAEGLVSTPWDFRFEGSWRADLDRLETFEDEAIRLAAVVHPNNPTGAYFKADEWAALKSKSARMGWSVVWDQVFAEFSLGSPDPAVDGAAGHDADSLPTVATLGASLLTRAEPLSPGEDDDVPIFILDGLSKRCGLPQMKLGWILLAGSAAGRREAQERLAFLCDTYLSVSTPVQCALPRLLAAGRTVRRNIMQRVRSNDLRLREALDGTSAQALPVEGGWSAIVRLPAMHSEDEWCRRLLERGIWVHPGYFYDLSHEEQRFVVVSLIVSPDDLAEGLTRLASLLPV